MRPSGAFVAFHPAGSGAFVKALGEIDMETSDPADVLRKPPGGPGALASLSCHYLPQWMYVGRGDLAEHMMSCSHVLRVERLEADLLVTAAQYPNHRNFSKVLAPPSLSRCPRRLPKPEPHRRSYSCRTRSRS